MVVEDHDRNIVFHTVVHCLSIHHLEVLGEYVFEGDVGVTYSVWVLQWIFRIDPADLSTFKNNVCFDFPCPESSGGISRDKRTPRSGGQDGDSAFFQVAYTPASDERFGDAFHSNGSLQPRWDTCDFESVLQCEAVDDSGQHSHVVRSWSFDRRADCGKVATAKNVAAAADDCELHSGIVNSLDLLRYVRHFGHRDSGLAGSAEAVAAQLEQDAFVNRCDRFLRHHDFLPER